MYLGSVIRQIICVILWCKTMRLNGRTRTIARDQQKARVDLDGCFDSGSQTCSITLHDLQSCKGSHKGEERGRVVLSSPNTMSFFIGYFYPCRLPGVNLPAEKTFIEIFEMVLIPKLAKSIILHVSLHFRRYQYSSVSYSLTALFPEWRLALHVHKNTFLQFLTVEVLYSSRGSTKRLDVSSFVETMFSTCEMYMLTSFNATRYASRSAKSCKIWKLFVWSIISVAEDQEFLRNTSWNVESTWKTTDPMQELISVLSIIQHCA